LSLSPLGRFRYRLPGRERLGTCRERLRLRMDPSASVTAQPGESLST